MSDALVVNGRFLRAKPTGVHRVARSLLHELRSRTDATVYAPRTIDDSAVGRRLWAPPGRVGDHVWEQFLLPIAASRTPIVSLGNTAPVVARRAAVMVYDLATRVGPEWFRRELRLYGAMSVAAARRAEVVMTDSHQVAGELEDAGVEAGRISVVRPAVDERVRRATDDQIAEVRARFELTRPYVLHVGWADPRKDAATLAAAHLRVVADRPHDLVLAGLAHPNFAPVEVPQAPTIRRVGYVTDDELTQLLSGAALLAYPSRYEGFGIPPLEAMTCGTPTVVSDIPALRESTENRATYVPPGDVDAWVDALCAALDGEIEVQEPPAWTWSDAGDQLLKALAPLLA